MFALTYCALLHSLYRQEAVDISTLWCFCLGRQHIRGKTKALSSGSKRVPQGIPGVKGKNEISPGAGKCGHAAAWPSLNRPKECFSYSHLGGGNIPGSGCPLFLAASPGPRHSPRGSSAPRGQLGMEKVVFLCQKAVVVITEQTIHIWFSKLSVQSWQHFKG